MTGKPELKPIAYILLAGVIYGIMNFFSGRGYLPGCSFAEFRPQIAVPMFMGFAFGPLAGFITGCAGDSLGYALSGDGWLFAWNWSIANGFIGMIPGLAWRFGVRRVVTIRHFQLLIALILAAASLPILFAIATDVWRIGAKSAREALYTLFLPIFITDAVLGVMIVPGLLVIARRLVVSIETRMMLMMTHLLVLTVLGTYAASLIATWDNSPAGSGFVVRDLYTIGIMSLFVLVVGLALASLVSQRIVAPVVGLTDAARAIGAGDYTPQPALEKVGRRPDELGQLARVFQKMVAEVYAREQPLKNEVGVLKIEIDKSRQQAEVARITGTDYFKQLRAKADSLRLKSDAARSG